ncbi:MAG TPA: DnaJ domain-containing protein, partial [Syntrophales bacterium]|nr:DnaJ domain-containing protein [Syntrophales bacterium]
MRQIKKAYRRLALKYHPDRNSRDAAAAEKMKSINEAYATLSNPEKRHDYDLMNDGSGSAYYDRFGQYDTVQDILWIITNYSK